MAKLRKGESQNVAPGRGAWALAGQARAGNGEGNEGNNEGNEGNREGNVRRGLNAMRNAPALCHATIERAQKTLQADGRIRRVGGTRGHWEIVR